MPWQPKGPDHAHLNMVLTAVLPQYRALSTRLGDELGTFKSIDSEGNVWLVQYQEPYTDERGHHVVRRAKRLALKKDDAEAQAGARPVHESRQRKDLW